MAASRAAKSIVSSDWLMVGKLDTASLAKVAKVGWSGLTANVMWAEDPFDVAECSTPRGRYKVSPAFKTNVLQLSFATSFAESVAHEGNDGGCNLDDADGSRLGGGGGDKAGKSEEEE